MTCLQIDNHANNPLTEEIQRKTFLIAKKNPYLQHQVHITFLNPPYLKMYQTCNKNKTINEG